MPRTRSNLRERILEVALELFNDQGYDKTSLREIAERLGVTKAAVYYHFESKGDILLELHLRLHELGAGLLDEIDRLGGDHEVVAAWPTLVERFIENVMANRDLFLVHQRNQRAFAEIADDERHREANDDIEERFRRLLASPDIPLEARVRMAASIGAVLISFMSSETLFGDAEPATIAGLLRATVRDLLETRAATPGRRGGGSAKARGAQGASAGGRAPVRRFSDGGRQAAPGRRTS